MQTVQAVWTWIVANWGLISGIAAGLSMIVSSLITARTNHPQEETWYHRIQGWLSWVQHADVGGFKPPLTKLKRPAVGQPVKPADATNKGFARLPFWLLAVCFVASSTSCASVSWTTPALSAGPTVVPIEEVSGKHPSPAAATGFQETLELGQFEAMEHVWSALDISVFELGGAALSAAAPAGMFQLGGGIGTMNSIAGFALLTDVADANGNGWAQGGNPGGVIWGGYVNIAAIVAEFGATGSPEKLKAHPKPPRGGL